MATRTIENPRDRLVTMLVAPLMSCSARMPVYTLLIAAFIPDIVLLGFLPLPGLRSSWLSTSSDRLGPAMHGLDLQEDCPAGSVSGFIMELPPYRRRRSGRFFCRCGIARRSFSSRRARSSLVSPSSSGSLPRTRESRGRRPPEQLETELCRTGRAAHRAGHQTARIRLEDRDRPDRIAFFSARSSSARWGRSTTSATPTATTGSESLRSDCSPMSTVPGSRLSHS